MWGLGSPFLLWLGRRMVIVLRNWGLSWLLAVIVFDWSWLMMVVLNWSWSYNGSCSWAGVLLTERGIVPTRIVLSIFIALVVIAAALVIKVILGLSLLLILWLSLLLVLWLSLLSVLWLRGSMSWCWWSSRGYRQMISRSLESIFASNVGDGSSLSRWIKVAVGSSAVAISIRFLLEVGSIFLIVSSTELSISGKVSLLAYDRNCLGITVISIILGTSRYQQR